MFKYEFTEEQINLILEALSELSYKKSAKMISLILERTQAQIKKEQVNNIIK